MSGHSKWSTIKRQKGAADAHRSAAFTKLSRAIAVAARGGADPEHNIALRLALLRARAARMPGDTIERAIARGSGTAADAALEPILYEALGPAHVALLVNALTDNKNRTTSDLRMMLARHGGELTGTNSVRWMFTERGVIRVPRAQWPQSAEALELKLIDAGVEDLVVHEDRVTCVTRPEGFAAVLEELHREGITDTDGQLSAIATDTILVSPQDLQRVSELVKELESHDDITDVATNAEGPDGSRI